MRKIYAFARSTLSGERSCCCRFWGIGPHLVSSEGGKGDSFRPSFFRVIVIAAFAGNLICSERGSERPIDKQEASYNIVECWEGSDGCARKALIATFPFFTAFVSLHISRVGGQYWLDAQDKEENVHSGVHG